MALEVERTPARADLLYARGLPGPNRSGGRGTVYESGLPESAPKTNLPLEHVYHTSSGEARAEARQARLTTGAEATTLAAGSFCQGNASRSPLPSPWYPIEDEGPMPPTRPLVLWLLVASACATLLTV